MFAALIQDDYDHKYATKAILFGKGNSFLLLSSLLYRINTGQQSVATL